DLDPELVDRAEAEPRPARGRQRPAVAEVAGVGPDRRLAVAQPLDGAPQRVGAGQAAVARRHRREGAEEVVRADDAQLRGGHVRAPDWGTTRPMRRWTKAAPFAARPVRPRGAPRTTAISRAPSSSCQVFCSCSLSSCWPSWIASTPTSGANRLPGPPTASQIS